MVSPPYEGEVLESNAEIQQRLHRTIRGINLYIPLCYSYYFLRLSFIITQVYFHILTIIFKLPIQSTPPHPLHPLPSLSVLHILQEMVYGGLGRFNELFRMIPRHYEFNICIIYSLHALLKVLRLKWHPLYQMKSNPLPLSWPYFIEEMANIEAKLASPYTSKFAPMQRKCQRWQLKGIF